MSDFGSESYGKNILWSDVNFTFKPCVTSGCNHLSHVYVVTAFKDGGAAGYDDWRVIDVCETKDLAFARCRSYVAVERPSARWQPSIQERALVRSLP